MANPEKSGVPTTTVHSPMKGYVTMAPVNQPPPPPPYSQHQPPHQSTHPGGYSISGLISPPASHTAESRRTSDDDYHQQQPQQQPRLSLPSITEAIYNPARPAQGPAPPAPPPPQSFPNSNPFARPAPPSVGPPPPSARPYSAIEERPTYPPQTGHSHYVRRSPPPPLHPAPSYTADPAYGAERHPPLSSLRTALPSQTGPYSPRHHAEQQRYEPAPRPIERRDEFHPPPPPQRRTDSYYGYAPAPANGYQSGYPPRPASPYHSQESYASRLEHLRPYSRDDPMARKRDIENGESPSMMFQKQLRHNLGNHDFEMALGELQQCGGEVQKIADDLLDTVRRYQNNPDMHGIPVMRYHDSLLGCQRKIEEAFTNVKGFMAQQQRQLDDHRMRNEDKRADYGDEESWGMDKDQGFHGGSDAKKIRRGRAAPPGRCHSCNRAETPEWRRGPDGARTLCNACGLHYAKLTRRMGNKNAQSAAGSSLRPKSMDGVYPSQ